MGKVTVKLRAENSEIELNVQYLVIHSLGIVSNRFTFTLYFRKISFAKFFGPQ